jgi:hypothetical protein
LLKLFQLSEREKSLLERAVSEEWFPRGVLPKLGAVVDTLLTLVDQGEIAVYGKVCDYLVNIAK